MPTRNLKAEGSGAVTAPNNKMMAYSHEHLSAAWPLGVKVSGITSLDELRSSIAAGAFAVGFSAASEIPVPKLGGGASLSNERIRELSAFAKEAAPPGLWRVLITARTSGASISDHIHETGVNAVRITKPCGPRDWTIIRAAHPSVKIIQELDPFEPELIAPAKQADPYVDALLLDCASDDGQVDGRQLGKAWQATREIASVCVAPIILAGNLSEETIEPAVSAARPDAVAVSIKTTKGQLTSVVDKFFAASKAVGPIAEKKLDVDQQVADEDQLGEDA